MAAAGGQKPPETYARFLKRVFVGGGGDHGVEQYAIGEQSGSAIGGAESGNQNGAAPGFCQPRSRVRAVKKCGDGFVSWPFRQGEWRTGKRQLPGKIEPKNSGKQQKSARESLLRLKKKNFGPGGGCWGTVDVGAELPAFHKPRERDQRQAEIGPKALTVLNDQRRRNVTSMMRRLAAGARG